MEKLPHASTRQRNVLRCQKTTTILLERYYRCFYLSSFCCNSKNVLCQVSSQPLGLAEEQLLKHTAVSFLRLLSC